MRPLPYPACQDHGVLSPVLPPYYSDHVVIRIWWFPKIRWKHPLQHCDRWLSESLIKMHIPKKRTLSDYLTICSAWIELKSENINPTRAGLVITAFELQEMKMQKSNPNMQVLEFQRASRASILAPAERYRRTTIYLFVCLFVYLFFYLFSRLLFF